jgi:hypothetical protein
MTTIAFRPSGDFTWAAGAPCGQPDAPNMFPADNDTKGRRAAKALCDRCPASFSASVFALVQGAMPRMRRTRLTARLSAPVARQTALSAAPSRSMAAISSCFGWRYSLGFGCMVTP